MLQVLGTWLLTSITFLITSYVVPGFNVAGLGAALWASAIVGLLNMFASDSFAVDAPGEHSDLGAFYLRRERDCFKDCGKHVVGL